MPFTRKEYLQRVESTKASMEAKGLDVLLVADPANQHYLTGYDGWSFYTPQTVVVAHELEEPLCIVRGMDANGARVTTFLAAENIYGYPDRFVQARSCHPYEYIAEVLVERGIASGRIGLEMDNYYFSAFSYERLKAQLGNVRFEDATGLVNWIRSVKSKREIEMIERSARIVEKVMLTAYEAIAPGVRQCDAVAEIYRAGISGTEEFGGDYPSIVPMLPSGIGTSTPHLTWSDDPFNEGEATILELAGCYRRYHCPMARTLFLGQPPQHLIDTAKIVMEGLEAALEAVKPGVTCEHVEEAWRDAVARHGIVKDSRIGYSVGLNYPPDWGEHTVSLRPGDETELEPDMTLHMIPGIWHSDWGIEISECFLVTENGAETFCSFPRDLYVKR